MRGMVNGQENKLNFSQWKMVLHDRNLKIFQICYFPELYFSYSIVNGKKKMNPLIYEEENDGEVSYIFLLEEDPFYQNLQLFLDRMENNHE